MLKNIILFLTIVFYPAVSSSEATMPFYDLTIDFDLASHAMKGVARISLPAGKTAKIRLEGLGIISASVNDKLLITEPGMQTLNFTPGTEGDVLTIEYSVDTPTMADADERQEPGAINVVGSDSIMLSGSWYPSLETAALFRLTALLPEGLEGISEAEEVLVEGTAEGRKKLIFLFPHPLKAIHFVAGRYHVERISHGGTEISAYVFPESMALAKSYIDTARNDFNIHESRIGRYPFRRFSIVETRHHEGYVMPTVALIGKDDPARPYASRTSIGREILRQWFGALVDDEMERGFWAAGLTTYLAEHLSGGLAGRRADLRKNALMDFQSYVNPGNDSALISFGGGNSRAARAVGYGKSAMVFHMLRGLTGDDRFYAAIRSFLERKKFSAASWDDIRKDFESVCSTDLGWFFRQWVEGKGALDIEIQDAQLLYRGSRAVVSFEVVQKSGPYRALLPVALKMSEGEVVKLIEIDKQTARFEIEAEGVPVELVADELYDLFRKLTEPEQPPSLAALFGSRNKIFVMCGKEKEYADLAGLLAAEGFLVKKETEITYEDLKASSFLVPTRYASFVKRTIGKIEPPEGEISFSVRRNPFNRNGVMAVFEGRCSLSAAYIDRLITDYGIYSDAGFTEGSNTLKTMADSDNGIGIVLTEDAVAVEISRLTKVSEIIKKEWKKKILYVGEGHDRLEHHRIQLEVIRELHKKNPSIAIAMEMFQKPFQKVIDEYISGTIDEKEFLKKSEYFKRWGFDYNLYREILLYARQFRLPVIALNIARETVSKVARDGIHSLTPEEQKNLPEYFELSDESYRMRLMRFFERHQNPGEKNFDFFYQAQVLWDESMSQNLNEFMEKNPERQVVVIAGVGHMAFGSGIPKRTYRLNKQPYAIILNGEEVDEHVGDYVVFPVPLKAVESPKLMIQFREEGGKIIISGFPADSISEKAGLLTDDTIVSLDGTKIEGVDDVKIFLLYKKKGDEVKVRVMRKLLFFGPKELEFTVTL